MRRRPLRVAGIDPGAHTALVCVDVPWRVPAPGGVPVVDTNPRNWAWLGAREVRVSAAKSRTDAERDATLFVRAHEQLSAWRPDVVVLEEPADAIGKWVGAAGRQGSAARGGTRTAFALGRAYGLALAAARLAVGAGRVVSYPVTTTKRGRARGILGWMQGTQGKPTPRKVTLDTVYALLRDDLAVDPRVLLLPSGEHREDVLCAFGVLCYHLRECRDGALLAPIPAAPPAPEPAVVLRIREAGG